MLDGRADVVGVDVALVHPGPRGPVHYIQVSVKKHSSGEEDTWDMPFKQTPNHRLDSSFCCWVARQRLAQKECSFTDAGMRGWRNTVGSLIEMCWLNTTCHGPQLTRICGNNRGVRLHRILDFKQYYLNSIPPTLSH